MKKIKNHIERGTRFANKVANELSKASKTAKKYWDDNKDEFNEQGRILVNSGQQYLSGALGSASNSATNLYRDFKYSEDNLRDLEKRIRYQGGYYRELIRNTRNSDSIILGGEMLVTLLAGGNIPEEILKAYEAAYPDLAQQITFEDKVRELDPDAMAGFVSGVKGKLFEMKYVDYLNAGNLPEGYTAVLAGSATQAGWDIAVEGQNGEIASVLQAKATDSVSYVQEALEKYPGIDVVTTDEVYSHLVMSGISDNLVNGSISNVELIDALEEAVDASDLSMEFTPPLLTLAFVAFTSYKDESLSLFEKAKQAGDRSGKAYLSYLVGGGVAALTNAWWLGVIGSVGSRLISDRGDRKYEVYRKLHRTELTNQRIIDRMDHLLAGKNRARE